MKYILITLILLISGIILLQSQNNKVKINTNVVETPTSTPKPTNMNDQITQLKIEDLKSGTGAEVKSGDTVVINYKGTLLDSTKFDSSYDRGQPFETVIGVGKVIKGWDIGVLGMKVGGKRKLTIPSDMAYGQQGAGDLIPPNAPLIFELELLSIK